MRSERASRLPIVAFFIVVALCLSGWRLTQRTEEQALRDQTWLVSGHVEAQLGRVLDNRLHLLMALGDSLRAGRTTSGETLFRVYSEALLKRFLDWVSVEWIDAVFVVRDVVARRGYERPTGRDLKRDPVTFDVLLRAVNARGGIVRPLLDSARGWREFELLLPLWRDGHFDGFLSGRFGVDRVMEACWSSRNSESFELVVLVGDRTVWASSAETTDSLPGSFDVTAEVPIADSRWTIIVRPSVVHKADLLCGGAAWLAWSGLIIGAGCAGILRVVMMRHPFCSAVKAGRGP